MNEIKTIQPQIDISYDEDGYVFDSFIHCHKHDIPLKIRASDDQYIIRVESCSECLAERLKIAGYELAEVLEKLVLSQKKEDKE